MDISIMNNGQPAVLIASCLGDGDTGGGLLFFDGATWHQVDGTSTTGLFYDGVSLSRILWAPSQVAEGTAILRYDRTGLCTFTRVDGLSDPHDVVWDGTHYIAVSSASDSILWIYPSGEIRRRFQPVPSGDCWHLNSLLPAAGRLFACAFGRFDQPRGWTDHKMDGSGILFDVETGEDILTGLCCPHTPKQLNGGWLLCNSARSELLFRGANSTSSVQLENWTRGIAVSDSHIFVGESVNRQISTEINVANVAVVCRATLQVLSRLPLPYREVYDLTIINYALLAGLLRAPAPHCIWTPPQIPLANPASAF